MKPKLSLKNVKSFFQANSRIVYDMLIGLPLHTQDQIAYRHSLCEQDCFVEGACKYCGCNPYAKAFSTTSCNEGKRFPDLMGEEEWKEFKKNINE